MDKSAAEYTDLDTVHAMVRLLQNDKGVTFGNDKQWVELFERRNAAAAFSIAYEAVFRVPIPERGVEFIETVIQGMGFWMRQAELRREASDG